MRRPTGFIKDNSYVALDVDMWCPDVVVVCVCVGGGGGGGLVCVCVWGGVCVSRDTFELQ